jgi:ABC-type multidrug transport system fused ATPase/permease subunit
MSIYRAIKVFLSPEQRRVFRRLLVLMLTGSILEMASIGMIVPVLALASSTDPAAVVGLLHLPLSIENLSREKLILVGASVLLLCYLVKSAFLAYMYWKLNTFVFDVRAEVSKKLFSLYLRQPWSFHLQRNSAHLISVLATETNQFTAGILQPALILTVEVLVLAGIGLLMILVEPLGTLILFVTFGSAVAILQRFTRDRLARWGADRQLHESLRVQHAQEGLGGAKEVKLLGREEEFINAYDVHNRRSANAVERLHTMQQLPRLLLEVLGIGALTVLAFVIVWQGKSPSAVLTTMGLFAAAGLRIMPSINRMVGSIQSLRYSRPTVEVLSREFDLPSSVPDCQPCSIAGLSGDISLEGVSFAYPGSTREALSQVSLSIRRGSSVGFIGQSGSGKSTLIDVLLGLLEPTTGSVRVGDVDVRLNLRGWQSSIGYVPQTIFLADSSLRRNIAFGIPEGEIDDQAVWTALRAARLDDFVQKLPEGLHSKVGERGVRLSGGQRQRIGIARALYHDPEVIVMDEATSALDSATENEVMDAVNALMGVKTVILVAHRLSTLSRCQQIFCLENGKISKANLSAGSAKNPPPDA